MRRADSACRQVLEEQNARLQRELTAQINGATREQTNPFDDFFGMDYTHDDFLAYGDDESMEGGTECDGSQWCVPKNVMYSRVSNRKYREMDLDSEKAYESTSESHNSEAEEDDDDEEDEEEEEEQERRRLGEVVGERHAAHSKLLYRPARIDTFNDVVTGARAGSSIGEITVQGTQHGNAAYTQFTHDVQTLSRCEGSFAPFLSRTDWEVACWAKTRGTGSNALDDLLGIEGVSFNIFRTTTITF